MRNQYQKIPPEYRECDMHQFEWGAKLWTWRYAYSNKPLDKEVRTKFWSFDLACRVFVSHRWLRLEEEEEEEEEDSSICPGMRVTTLYCKYHFVDLSSLRTTTMPWMCGLVAASWRNCWACRRRASHWRRYYYCWMSVGWWDELIIDFVWMDTDSRWWRIMPT